MRTEVAGVLPASPSRVPARGAAAVTLFVLIAGAFVAHVLNERVVTDRPDLARWGLIDFRDAVYYPTRAWLDGVNPYDVARYRAAYPVGCPFPPYGPHALLLYVPFALLPYQTAAAAFLVLNVCLVPVLAWLVLRWSGVVPTLTATFVLATLVLVSRGGYVNLFLGQCTAYVALASFAAFALAATRPGLAGAALALALLKPTIGGPFALLLLARREWRTVAIGTTLAAGLAAVPIAVLTRAAGGVGAFVGTLLASEGSFSSDPTNSTDAGPMRVDAAALVGRALGTPLDGAAQAFVAAVILGVAMLAIARLDPRRRDEDWQLAATIACVATLLCVYQQVYGLLLLVLPLTSWALGAWLPRAGLLRALRWPIVILLAIPSVNFVMSRTTLGWLDLGHGIDLRVGVVRALAAVNATALLAAFVVVTGAALGRPAALPGGRP